MACDWATVNSVSTNAGRKAVTQKRRWERQVFDFIRVPPRSVCESVDRKHKLSRMKGGAMGQRFDSRNPKSYLNLCPPFHPLSSWILCAEFLIHSHTRQKLILIASCN